MQMYRAISSQLPKCPVISSTPLPSANAASRCSSPTTVRMRSISAWLIDGALRNSARLTPKLRNTRRTVALTCSGRPVGEGASQVFDGDAPIATRERVCQPSQPRAEFLLLPPAAA
jgi:hypothetical protein